MAKRSIPLYEVVNLLEQGSSLEDIEINLLPPDEEGGRTDEESGGEDEFDINHLPGRLLRQEVEVTVGEEENFNNIGEKIVEDCPNIDTYTQRSASMGVENDLREDGCSSPQEDEYSASRGKKRKKIQNVEKSKKIAKESMNWLENEKIFRKEIAGCGDTEQLQTSKGTDMTSVDCFELLFGEDLINLLVENSNIYAITQYSHQLNVTADEIKTFIGILLLTGYLSPKFMRMLWETQSDTYNTLVSESMRRDRFLEFQRFIHLADNSKLPPNDKFGKVRKYFNLLNANFIRNFEIVGSSHLSIDESMIPYYGKNSCKQHIKGKPIRFGYKIWSCATRSGYLATFEPYQGSKAAALPLQEKFGLGASVILELSSRLPKELAPYNIYFDNFFTSIEILQQLSERNIGGTGTIRENRIGNCPLTSTAEMKKTKREVVSSKIQIP